MSTARHPLVCLCVTFFLTAVLASMFYAGSVHAANTSVTLVPSSLTTSLGQSFNVDIMISNVVDLYAWEFRLNWSAAILDVVEVDEGPFLRQGGPQTFFTYNVSSADGRMVVDCSLLGIVPGVKGNGVMATATFHAKNNGDCPLDLYEVSLIDSFEQTISCQIIGGYVRVVSQHDITVMHIYVSPTVVLPGDVVAVNVTVRNQGSYPEIFNVTTITNSTVVGTQQISLSSDSSTTVPFAWNTIGFLKGDYVIQGSASPVEGESDVEDNNKTADTPVIILGAGHDVAVVSVKSFKTVVGQGFNIKVTVTVRNYGLFSETLNVTAYLNTTVIETLTTTLASGGEAQLLFINSTLGMTKGNYTLSAAATSVPEETETADNRMSAGIVTITVQGDINGDAEVNIYDAILLSSAFSSVPDSSNWNPNADINGDSVVDVYDAILVAGSFGLASQS